MKTREFRLTRIWRMVQARQLVVAGLPTHSFRADEVIEVD